VAAGGLRQKKRGASKWPRYKKIKRVARTFYHLKFHSAIAFLAIALPALFSTIVKLNERNYMVSDDDVTRADDDAKDAEDNAKQIRQQAIDEHRQAAEDEEDKAEELE